MASSPFGYTHTGIWWVTSTPERLACWRFKLTFWPSRIFMCFVSVLVFWSKHSRNTGIRKITFQMESASRKATRTDNIFWILAPCKFVGRCQHFGETFCFHLQGLGLVYRRNKVQKGQLPQTLKQLFHTTFPIFSCSSSLWTLLFTW